jgi:hypothetical protein
VPLSIQRVYKKDTKNKKKKEKKETSEKPKKENYIKPPSSCPCPD